MRSRRVKRSCRVMPGEKGDMRTSLSSPRHGRERVAPIDTLTYLDETSYVSPQVDRAIYDLRPPPGEPPTHRGPPGGFMRVTRKLGIAAAAAAAAIVAAILVIPHSSAQAEVLNPRQAW